jgi:hypothetical protein
MWSLGALLELESREKLEVFLRNHGSHLDLPDIPEGTNQTMYEFYVTDYGKYRELHLQWNDLGENPELVINVCVCVLGFDLRVLHFLGRCSAT